MHLEGKITFEYNDEEKALNVSGLIQLDNDIAPRTIEIKTAAEGKKAVTRIKSERVSTFFSTVDDLLFSEKLVSRILEI
jgi:hypothetical protein